MCSRISGAYIQDANMALPSPDVILLQDRSLYRRHGLKLVTTSLIYERVVKEIPASIVKVHEEADGMAASAKVVADRYDSLLKSGEQEVPAMQVVS